ncbi:hypothetical protein H1R20_g6750, partial [Candolleomyces eurysporus]
MSDYLPSSRRSSKKTKSSRSSSGLSSSLDFLKDAKNFTTGDVSVHHTDGDFYDRSTKDTHNNYARHTKYEFHNPNSRAPIFNSTAEGLVTNYDGEFVMSNSQGTFYPQSYPIGDMQDAPQQKPSYVKRDKHGSEGYVFSQPNSYAPMFNGPVRGPVKNHTNSVSLEGYGTVPEGFKEPLDAYSRSMSRSDHRYSRGRNVSEPVPPLGHRSSEYGQYFSQPMQNEPSESLYNNQPYGSPANRPARHRKGQNRGAYPTPSSSIGSPTYDPRSGHFPQQGPAQHGYGYEYQYGSQGAVGRGDGTRSSSRGDVDDWLSQTTESLGQFHIHPTEDSSEDSEDGPAHNLDRGGIGGSIKGSASKSGGKRRAAEPTGPRV